MNYMNISTNILILLFIMGKVVLLCGVTSSVLSSMYVLGPPPPPPHPLRYLGKLDFWAIYFVALYLILVSVCQYPLFQLLDLLIGHEMIYNVFAKCLQIQTYVQYGNHFPETL